MRLALAIIVLVAALPAVARAESCPAIDGAVPELTQVDARERLDFLERRLVPDGRRSLLYSALWGGTFTGIAGYELVQSRSGGLTRDARERHYVEAGSAMLTPAFIVGMPLYSMIDGPRIRSLSRRAGNDLDPCAALARAEILFLRDARLEAEGVHWLNHAFSLVSNVALAGYLGRGRGWKTTGLLFAGGLASSELQIFTQPTDAVAALDEYRHARFATRDPPSVIVVPFVSEKHAAGVIIAATF